MNEPYADEISIPPVTSHAFGSDVSADEARDLEDSFFVRRAGLDAAHGHAAHGGQDHDHDIPQIDPRTAQKMSIAAHARRQHLSRYVKWTVGVSAALLLLGVGRVAFRGKPEIGPPPPIVHTAFAATADTTPHSIALQDPSVAAVNPQLAQPAAPPDEESQAAADKAVAALDNPAATTPPTQAATQPAAPVQAPTVAEKPADLAPQPASVAPATPAAPAAVSDKTAAQEKKDASKLLERGNAKGAIEAGERSVALDSADGEAWLVLGAAYQEVGKNADARRCFNSCIKEGKRGPVSECRAMLQ